MPLVPRMWHPASHQSPLGSVFLRRAVQYVAPSGAAVPSPVLQSGKLGGSIDTKLPRVGVCVLQRPGAAQTPLSGKHAMWQGPVLVSQPHCSQTVPALVIACASLASVVHPELISGQALDGSVAAPLLGQLVILKPILQARRQGSAPCEPNQAPPHPRQCHEWTLHRLFLKQPAAAEGPTACSCRLLSLGSGT